MTIFNSEKIGTKLRSYSQSIFLTSCDICYKRGIDIHDANNFVHVNADL